MSFTWDNLGVLQNLTACGGCTKMLQRGRKARKRGVPEENSDRSGLISQCDPNSWLVRVFVIF
jgi:hypothetical protein